MAFVAPIDTSKTNSELGQHRHCEEDFEAEWWCRSCKDLRLVNNELSSQIADLRGELVSLKVD